MSTTKTNTETPTDRFYANACELSQDAHKALENAPRGRGLVHLVRAKMDADAALIEAVTALNKLDQAREEA